MMPARWLDRLGRARSGGRDGGGEAEPAGDGPSDRLPPGAGRRRRRGRWALLAWAAIVAGAALLVLVWASGDGTRILAAKGELVRADSTFLGVRGSSAHWDIRLSSDRGWSVRLRLREPLPRPSAAQLAVLIDGQGIGADAVDLLPEDAGTVAAALDYPAGFPESLTLTEALTRLPTLRRVTLQVPASVLLALEVLAASPTIDSTRIALIGSSLGVPAATAAAALDPRVDGVALVYGGGDLYALLDANLQLRSDLGRRVLARLGALLLAPLEPTRYAPRIAPRPLVLINGTDDPRIPRASVMALFDAARPPKRILWLPTGHLDPSDWELLRALADSAVAALPILTRTPAPTP